MTPMADADWGNFFDLIDRITAMPDMTWQEKMKLVEEKAASFGSEETLGEFCSWDWNC